MKKAQITIFISIGIIMMLSLLVFLFLSDDIDDVPKDSDYQIARNYIENCAKQVSEDAVMIIGLQGGYYDPIYYHEELGLKMSYLFYDETILVPTESFMAEELAAYVEDKMIFCANKTIIDYRFGSIDAEAQVNEASVSFRIDFPLELETKETKVLLDDPYFVTVKSSLPILRDTAEDIMAKSLDGYIGHSLIYDNMVNYTVDEIFPNALRFTLIRDDEAFIFLKESQSLDVPPRFNTRFIDLEANVGEYFRYNLQGSDDRALSFHTDERLFVLDESGEIIFLPERSQIGTHYIKVYAKDDEGNMDIAMIRLRIR